ncbi:MFS transporter [Metallosphaera tengchongensis]|uniref:MFS transporter n=1 Tax=Metallosphaera tengchongensis TaxID=1532350 RepID=A0A6N0NR04_9CREN|nr:MFS transporter [Metallosphaera tengchongensis]QKQ99121.1 MFS transporter [Metallosphaera tengchongensis]
MKSKILFTTSISHFINDGNSWFLPVTFTFLIEFLGISKLTIGILGSVFFAVSALAAPFITKIADRSKRYSVIMGLGILLWGLSLILFGISISAKSLLAIVISVALAGFSSAFYHPLGAAMLSITYRGSAGSALGINGSMGSLGRAIYPTLTLILFTLFHKDMLYSSLILGVISILASMTAFLATEKLQEYPDPKEPRSEEKEVNKGQGMLRSTMGIVILLTIIALLRSVFTQGISQFLPTLLVENFNYSYGVNLGEATSLALAAAVVGQPILGLLSDRVGRRLIFSISTLGAVIALMAFLKFADIVYLVIFGLFTYSAFPLMLSLVGDFVPRGSTGFANSLVWGLGVTGGGVIGPIIVGILSQINGLVFASYSIAIVGLLSAILVVLIPKPAKRSKVPLFG